MNDRLHGSDPGVSEEGEQSRANDRLAGDLPILFGNIAAGALATPARNNDRRDPARHESLTPLAISAML